MVMPYYIKNLSFVNQYLSNYSQQGDRANFRHLVFALK